MSLVIDLDINSLYLFSSYDRSNIAFWPNFNSEIRTTVLSKIKPHVGFKFEKGPNPGTYYISYNGLYLNVHKGKKESDSFIFAHESVRVMLGDVKDRDVFYLYKNVDRYYFVSKGDALSAYSKEYGKDIPLVRSIGYHLNDIKSKSNFQFKLIKLEKAFVRVPEIEDKSFLISHKNMCIDENLRLFGTVNENLKCFKNYFTVETHNDHYKLKHSNGKYVSILVKRVDEETITPSVSVHGYSSDIKLILTKDKDYDEKHDETVGHLAGTIQTNHIRNVLSSKFVITKVNEGTYKIQNMFEDSVLGIKNDTDVLIKEQDMVYVTLESYGREKLSKVLSINWKFTPTPIVKTENFKSLKLDRRGCSIILISILLILLFLLFLLILFYNKKVISSFFKKL
jgi:hypothetical protein